jgi:hypothetical protein
MNKCYVLGAGFSKAVSDLPVMKDLSEEFWQVRSQEHQFGNDNRVKWGNRIRDYLDYLEKEFFTKPCIRAGETYEECNFQENLEALISFIDLNTSGTIRARVVDRDGNKSSYSKRSLFWNFADLPELRTCIQTYLYLTLIKPEVNTEALDPIIRHISQTDKVITFNYDLIVERALYERGIWQPKDGYGITFKELPKIASAHNSRSRVCIYKLHGSLNWEKT